MPIIVPSSRLAVPLRPVIRPGWDDLPIDRPRRRSAWWRRLLAGAAGLTRLQPGACCGCGAGTVDCPGGCSGIPTILHVTGTVTVNGFGTGTLFSSIAAIYTTNPSTVDPNLGTTPGWVAKYGPTTLAAICGAAGAPNCQSGCNCTRSFTLYHLFVCGTSDQFCHFSGGQPDDAGTTWQSTSGTNVPTVSVQCSPFQVTETTAWGSGNCFGSCNNSFINTMNMSITWVP